MGRSSSLALVLPSRSPHSSVTDNPTLSEVVKAFLRRLHDGSDVDGTLPSFLAKVLYCSGRGEVVSVKVEFYRSHKVMVDMATQVPFLVQSSAPVHFFHPI